MNLEKDICCSNGLKLLIRVFNRKIYKSLYSTFRDYMQRYKQMSETNTSICVLTLAAMAVAGCPDSKPPTKVAYEREDHVSIRNIGSFQIGRASCRERV